MSFIDICNSFLYEPVRLVYYGGLKQQEEGQQDSQIDKQKVHIQNNSQGSQSKQTIEHSDIRSNDVEKSSSLDFFNQKVQKYDKMLQQYKQLKSNMRRLITDKGASGQHKDILNTYKMYNIVRQNYLRTLGFRKVKVIIVNQYLDNILQTNRHKINKALDNAKLKYLRKHQVYKTLQKVRTIRGLKKSKILPYSTLNRIGADGNNKRRMIRKSQTQVIYLNEQNNKLQLIYTKMKKNRKYMTKTYQMLREYQSYGKKWASQKFHEQYVKETLKYIDLLSTSRTIKIYDVYDVDKQLLYKLNQNGERIIPDSYIGQEDMLFTNFALQQVSKFSNNHTIKLIKNVHQQYTTIRYSETKYPEYYLFIKTDKYKHKRNYTDEVHKTINIRQLLKDYFISMRQGRNNIIIHHNYYKYKQIKPKTENYETKILFGNNKQKIIGFNFTDNFRQQLQPYIEMQNTPIQKRFKYKLRVLDYQILYNEPQMSSVFIG